MRMSKKEDFVKAFQKETGKHPKDFLDNKQFKEFSDIMNANPDLKALFREAKEEAEARNDLGSGMAGLFDGFD